MKYKLKFTDQQIEEIESLHCEGFNPDPTKAHPRSVWVAIGHMALGKSVRIESGAYGDDMDDMDDNGEWVNELQEIADIIFSEFKPGDMKV
jgi:hypothetical protein